MLPTSPGRFVLRMVVILLLVLKDCEAYRNWGFKKVVGGAGRDDLVPGRIDMNTEKEIFYAVPTTVVEVSSKIGGRKTRVERRQFSEETKKEGNEISEKSSNISGAISAGNCNDTWKRKLKMESKLSARSVHHLKGNVGGFMALNADYHMAHLHPPKNN